MIIPSRVTAHLVYDVYYTSNLFILPEINIKIELIQLTWTINLFRAQ